MPPSRRPFFSPLLNPRRLALGVCATGLPLLSLACAHPATPLVEGGSVLPALAVVSAAPVTPATVARAAAEEGAEATEASPQTLPEPANGSGSASTPTDASKPAASTSTAKGTAEAAPVQAAPDGADKPIPVSLDTVFRLAQDQNTQVRLARERVHGACADLDVAALAWVPKVYVGPSYYRHEGGIQDERGRFIHSSFGALFAGTEVYSQIDLHDWAYQQVKAEREVWQQKGELSRLTSDTLAQASEAYIDLLAGRSAEAVARSLAEQEQELLDFIKGTKESSLRAEQAAVQADLNAYQELGRKMREYQGTARARLAYLLGVDPCTHLVPVDGELVAFPLLDTSVPTCDLVARALAAGPGIHEMEGMLQLLHNSMAKAQGPSRLLPVFEVRMAEGLFGAGPGGRSDWDNRWDLAFQAHWDLGALVTASARQRSAESKLQQAHLNYEDLRGKLAAGVQEARETMLSDLEQMRYAQQRIKDSEDAYKEHRKLRDELMAEQWPAIVRELMQNIRSLEAVQRDYLETISGYDKAQLRLLLLLGPTAPPPTATCAQP